MVSAGEEIVMTPLLRFAKYYFGTTTGAEEADPGGLGGRMPSVLLASGTAGTLNYPYDIFEGT